jgi:hypothetical protein
MKNKDIESLKLEIDKIAQELNNNILPMSSFLDDKIEGLKPFELYVICGRPQKYNFTIIDYPLFIFKD